MGLKEQIMKSEGFAREVYQDTMGYPTVGYGFNLSRQDAKELLRTVDADLDKILYGFCGLSEAQAERLLEANISEASEYTRVLTPGYDQLPKHTKEALIEMVFQMGPGKYQRFHKMLGFLQKRKLELAALEALDSDWALQTPKRARNVSLRIWKSVGSLSTIEG